MKLEEARVRIPNVVSSALSFDTCLSEREGGENFIKDEKLINFYSPNLLYTLCA